MADQAGRVFYASFLHVFLQDWFAVCAVTVSPPSQSEGLRADDQKILIQPTDHWSYFILITHPPALSHWEGVNGYRTHLIRVY
ncbi:hypothetical protein CCP3SC1_1420001 [Gammaproteobacteria bacterium]